MVAEFDTDIRVCVTHISCYVLFVLRFSLLLRFSKKIIFFVNVVPPIIVLEKEAFRKQNYNLLLNIEKLLKA